MAPAWLRAKDALDHIIEHTIFPDIAEKELVLLLKEGLIPCRAEKLIHGRGEQANALIPREFWDPSSKLSWDWEKGFVKCDNSAIHSPSFGPAYPGHFSASGVEMSERHLLEYWPRVSQASPEKDAVPPPGEATRNKGGAPGKREATRNKGGAPVKWDWEGAYIEMGRIVALEDENVDRATLSERVKNWFVGKFDNHPSDSLIRDKVKRFHETLWPPKT
jgi:hypothetical protein